MIFTEPGTWFLFLNTVRQYIEAEAYISFLTSGSSNRLPIRRFVAWKVFAGFVTAWRFAGIPTSLSLSFVKATTLGVVLAPSAFSNTLAVFPSMMATHEFVVPRSIPMTWPLTLSDLETDPYTELHIMIYDILTLKAQNMTAADDIHKYFFIVFQRK